MKTQRTPRRRAAFVVRGGSLSLILLAWLGACQSSPAPSDDDDDDGGGGSLTEPPKPSGWTPEERCQRMLECLSLTNPEQASADLPTFGASGTCWANGEDQATCGTICGQRLEELHQNHRHEPACAECVSDADCGEARVCASGACIERCEDSFTGCCDALCAASYDKGCKGGIFCSDLCVELVELADPACTEALIALWRCQATGLPDSMICSQSTDPSILLTRCDTCVAEREAVPIACGEQLPMPCE